LFIAIKKLGINDLAAQNYTILQKKYPDYVDAQGNVKVDLGAQNENRSWLNAATFNLVGSKNTSLKKSPAPQPNKAN
jgi:hypothetical protein